MIALGHGAQAWILRELKDGIARQIHGLDLLRTLRQPRTLREYQKLYHRRMTSRSCEIAPLVQLEGIFAPACTVDDPRATSLGWI